jgi:hypothetical protein
MCARASPESKTVWKCQDFNGDRARPWVGLEAFLVFMALPEGALGGLARLVELLSGQGGANGKRPD